MLLHYQCDACADAKERGEDHAYYEDTQEQLEEEEENGKAG